MKSFSPKVLNAAMYILIIFTLLAGGSVIIEEAYTLLFKPETLDVLRTDLPWFRPIDDATILFNMEITGDKTLFDSIEKNLVFHDVLERLFFLVLTVLTLFELKRIIISIRTATFFTEQNITGTRQLAILFLLWALSRFILYHMIAFFIPVEHIQHSINYIPFSESAYQSIMISLDFSMLVFALILYFVYLSFKQGYQLKEETDLTI